MAKVVPLFSGSKGNCYYIGTSAQGVLIDAGRSCKQIELAMEANGLSMKNVSALFITHEHTDHCSAVKVLSRRYGLKVFGSNGTLSAISRGLYPETKLEVIESELALCDMNIRRINTPHDAAESCCYRVTASDGKSALIATDMGNLEAEEGGMLLKTTAEKRMGKPEELGFAIASVADERNGYLAGVDVLVDGGSVIGKKYVK